jgi:hypothetical protein
MVGNSLRSDILPVLALGASAVYVPYRLTWVHEVADPPPVEQAGYYELEHLGLLPGLLEELERLDLQARSSLFISRLSPKSSKYGNPAGHEQ